MITFWYWKRQISSAYAFDSWNISGLLKIYKWTCFVWICVCELIPILKGDFFFFWNDLSFQAIRISKINYLNIHITEVQGDWCSCKGKYILKILHQGGVMKPIPKMVFQYWSMRIMSNYRYQILKNNKQTVTFKLLERTTLKGSEGIFVKSMEMSMYKDEGKTCELLA